jgi:hypothetical protein
MTEEHNIQKYLSDEELINYLNQIIKDFKGQLDELENAMGALLLGRHIGIKPLYILHSKASIKKYQQILNLNFKEQMPTVGYKAEKMVGWKVAKSVSNFWKLVSGDLPDYKKTKEWKTTE